MTVKFQKQANGYAVVADGAVIGTVARVEERTPVMANDYGLNYAVGYRVTQWWKATAISGRTRRGFSRAFVADWLVEQAVFAAEAERVERLRALRREALRRRVNLNCAVSALGRFASNFKHGDDQLSRTASAIFSSNQGWAEAADRDAAFDGGEWSGPACDEARIADCEKAEAAFNAKGGAAYVDVLASRISGKAIYYLGIS
jgi:hypothetical protein